MILVRSFILIIIRKAILLATVPSQKLALVLTTSVPVTGSGEKVVKMLCIYYPVRFQEKQVKALLDSGSKVNAMNPNFAQKLDFKV